MSSSSPRNANSRSKSSLTEGRKRTQEVETGDEGAPVHAAEAISAPEGATAADLATSALDAAAGQPAEARDEGPTGVDPRNEPPINAESSPLGREILGAAEDMAGDWVPEARPAAGATPATPLELLDETDLVSDMPRGEASGLILANPSPPAMRDEEFLRRVVLPPLPQTSMPQTDGAGYGDEDLSDKTVISDPPSPELIASWGRPASATARALKRRMKTPVELTTLELVGLLTGSALAGGLIGALFMSVPQAGAGRASAPTAAISAPVQAAPAAAPIPVITPLPPAPRPTVEPLPPPETAAPAEPPATSRARKASRRSASSRKAAKKEWVDPFEQ